MQKKGDFRDLHEKIKEDTVKQDVVTDTTPQREFKSVEEVASYLDSKSDEQTKEQLRQADKPITERSIPMEKLFLMNQINLLPKTDATAAIRQFFNLKILHNKSNREIAMMFGERVHIVDILERTGIEMVKDAIAKSGLRQL